MGLSFRISFILTFALISTFASAEAWRSGGSPAIFSKSYTQNFNILPKEGRVSDEHMPWSEVYWRSQFGGIAARWFQTENQFSTALKTDLVDPNKQIRNRAARTMAASYRGYADRNEFFTFDELKRMPLEDMKELSPAEKFDIFLGNYTRRNFYSWTKNILAKNRVTADEWFGICHGWTGAAISYIEPAAVVVTNKDGIQVPFASSDVKGLLAQMFASNGFGTNTSQLGRRCSAGDRENCADVNPGALHIVMTNQLGLLKKPFAGDADNGSEVWNQPYTGFKVEEALDAPIYSDAAPGTAKVMKVRATLEYASDDVESQWDAMTLRKADGSMNGQEFAYQSMEYYLDLNRNGEIIGGKWLRGLVPDNRYIENPTYNWIDFDERDPARRAMMFPDFLWIARGTYVPSGDWAVLMRDIYQPAH